MTKKRCTAGLILAVPVLLLLAIILTACAAAAADITVVRPHSTICYHYRSAVTGKMVTKEYAMRNPTRTVRERC